MNKLQLFGEKTERLIFRKFDNTDFDAWLPFHQDPRSTQYWNGLPKDPVIACTQQFAQLTERPNKGLGEMNALTCITTGKLIGIAGLLVQTVSGVKELEIGYSILPEFWKNGYASEAARKCKTFAFENKITNSIISIIHIDNIPSQKVAINNGMSLDKTATYKDNPVHIYRVTI